MRVILCFLGQPDCLQNIGYCIVNKTRTLADHAERERDIIENSLLRKQTEILKHYAQASPKKRHFTAGNPAQILPQHMNIAC